MRRLALLLAAAAIVWGQTPAIAASTPTKATLTAHVLHVGSHGQRVKNLQWLLAGHRPSVFRIRAYRAPITGGYDTRTATAVKNMKWRLGWPRARVSATAGRLLGDVLEGHRTRPLAWRVTAANRLWHETKHTQPGQLPAKVRTLVDDARYLIGHASLVHYSQTVRMQIVRYHLRLPPLTRAVWEDCSSSTTALYWLAGLPDPNGLDYNGTGYTGTEAEHGRVVWRLGQSLALLHPGDLIFYGPFPHRHVTMYTGNGRVFSFGSDPGPYDLPVLYRSDAVDAHRYTG